MVNIQMPLRFVVSAPKMHLPAHDAWRVAYDRGLVSEEEWRAYEELIETNPFSWKGWLKLVGRGLGGTVMEARHESDDI